VDLYQRLINHFEGSQVAAARALGVSPQVLSNWKRRGLPPTRALDIERGTQGGIQAKEVLKSREAPQ
jgi:DNA-binding transcriptional regulator YdaS (Cro superfamily)